ncbi:MAG: hypothetical protein EXQ87_07570 [Alphaproteobacteria bacterium]|nr:hypothetical protein [Alphaproteobacteria bacterium]
MRNFAVRIRLASPVVVTDGYALDALLAHQLYETGQSAADLDLILRREGSVHAASWFFIEGGRHGAERWQLVRTQRAGDALDPRLVRTGTKTRTGTLKVDNKRGVAVNVLTPLIPVATPALWAFGAGDTAAVIDLLTGLGHVGRKRSAGFGTVERIDVLDVLGWAEIGLMDQDRQPMRAIPEDDWKGNAAPLGAYTLTFPRYVQNPRACVYPPSVILDAERLATWTLPADRRPAR